MPKKTTKTTKSDVTELEHDIRTAIAERSSLNKLADLLELAKSSNPEIQHKSFYALYRTFTLLFQNGYYSSTNKADEFQSTVRSWLLQRLEDFTQCLSSGLHSDHPSIQSASLQIAFSLLKQRSSNLSSSTGIPQMHNKQFRAIVRSVTSASTSIADTFLQEYINVHHDLRWFFLRELGLYLRTEIIFTEAQLAKILHLLENLQGLPSQKSEIKVFFIPDLGKKPAGQEELSNTDPMDEDEDEDDWRAYFDVVEKVDEGQLTKDGRTGQMSIHKSLHTVKAHKLQFTYTWLAFLSHIKASPELSSRVLGILHRTVMPHLTKPVLLMDWIVACIDFKGQIALLALNGLFILIRDHNLDYPDFYTKLYSMLDRSVLHARRRARFFRSLELFLSSTHLPATILASFAKRLSRLSLNAPPAAIIIVIPFVYNILKRHPSLMGMIHRDVMVTDEAYVDPYLATEPSPLLTNAIESSLWELQTHIKHYVPPVSTMAKILSQPFTKPSYQLEDFLDHTYGTLYEAETKRPIKTDPALVDKNLATEQPMSTISELWSF